MNKKLRLLVTTECHNKCPMCCNSSWDFSSLPVVDRWNYEEIMITGGEPLLYPEQVTELCKSIRTISEAQGKDIKIYLYTAINKWSRIKKILPEIDGLVCTPHSKNDFTEFVYLNDTLNYLHKVNPELIDSKSFRLNLFEDLRYKFKSIPDLHLWKIKDMEWIKDCPVPEGEDFRRLYSLL